MAIQFHVAAEADIKAQANEDDVVEVPIEDEVYYARRPTVAQIALLNAATSSDGAERLTMAFDLVEMMMGSEALAHVKRLVKARAIDYGDLIGGSEKNPDGGLIDMVFEEFAGRPTEPSTDSPRSPRAGGRKSTRRSPGPGSTHSAGPSTDS